MSSSPVTDALIVMGVAALPISELRGAIPLAIVHFQMSPLVACLLGVVGSLIPVVVLLLSLQSIVDLLSRVSVFGKVLHWLFARTRKSFSAKFMRWGAVALVALVALPLPVVGGAWTGCLIAFLFGIPFRQAFPLIGLGVGIAGLVVTLSTLGILRFLS